MREVEFLVSYIRGYIRGRLLAHAFTRAWIERNWNSRRLRCLLSLLLATWRGGSRSSRCWRYGHLVIFSVKDTLPSSGWRKWQLARLGTFSEETSPELSLTSDFSFFIRKIGRGREGIECRLISRQECLSSRSYSLIILLLSRWTIRGKRVKNIRERNLIQPLKTLIYFTFPLMNRTLENLRDNNRGRNSIQALKTLIYSIFPLNNHILENLR